MIKITEQNRIITYRNTDESIRTLYTSDDVSNLLEIKYPHYDKRETYQTIGDTILGFYKTSELAELLQKEAGVSADEAQKIVSDLSEFLAPVYEREKNEVPVKQQEMIELQQSFAQQELKDIQEKLQETPSKPAPKDKYSILQPMRTMDSDINRIHGYGAYRDMFPDEVGERNHTQEVIRSASQSNLLNEKPKLADIPTYQTEEDK